MGKSAGQSKETTNESSTSAPPPWVSAAQQSMLGGVQSTLSPYLQGNNFNPDQLKAFEGVRAEYNNPTQVPFTPMTSAFIDAGGPMSWVNAPSADYISAAQASAAQLDPNAYKAFMNPYENDVVQTTLANSREQLNRDLAGVRGRTAAASAFGGSGARGALQESQVTQDAARNRDAMVAQLRSQGFSQATASAMANTQLQQQTNLANASLEQQARVFNTSNVQQSLLQSAANQQEALRNNQQQATQWGIAQGQLDQQANQFNAAGLNANAMTNVGLQQQALQNLLGIGNYQYQVPMDAAKIMAAAIPQDFGGTKTGTSTTTKQAAPSQSPLQQLLGVGLSIAGAPATGGTSLLGGLGSLFK